MKHVINNQLVLSRAPEGPVAAYIDASAASGCRPFGDCIVARTRVGRDNADLSGGNTGDERAGTGQNDTAAGQGRSLSTWG